MANPKEPLSESTLGDRAEFRLFYAIAPTQFTGSGALDTKAVVSNIQSLSSRFGANRYLIGGAYGEFHALGDEERVELVAAVANDCGEATVLACAAAMDTGRTIDLAKRMRGVGADEIMVTAPLATEMSTADVLRHFNSIGDAVGGGLVLYNNPVFGIDLAPEVMAEVATHPAYVGIKQGTSTMGTALRAVDLVRVSRPDPPYLLGASDTISTLTLAAGASGISSTNCWVFPAAILGTVASMAESNLDRARRLHSSWRPYREFASAHGQPATVKAAMTLRGYDGTSTVRSPLVGLGPAAIDSLSKVLDRCDADLAGLGTSKDVA